MNKLLGILIPFLCGILSAVGVGGGSILVIYLTQFAHLSYDSAKFFNLVSFIPTALLASFINKKNGLINKEAAVCCAIGGAVFAAAFAFVGAKTDPELLKNFFGAVLLFAGVRELFKK